MMWIACVATYLLGVFTGVMLICLVSYSRMEE